MKNLIKIIVSLGMFLQTPYLLAQDAADAPQEANLEVIGLDEGLIPVNRDEAMEDDEEVMPEDIEEQPLSEEDEAQAIENYENRIEELQGHMEDMLADLKEKYGDDVVLNVVVIAGSFIALQMVFKAMRNMVSSGASTKKQLRIIKAEKKYGVKANKRAVKDLNRSKIFSSPGKVKDGQTPVIEKFQKSESIRKTEILVYEGSQYEFRAAIETLLEAHELKKAGKNTMILKVHGNYGAASAMALVAANHPNLIPSGMTILVESKNGRRYTPVEYMETRAGVRLLKSFDKIMDKNPELIRDNRPESKMRKKHVFDRVLISGEKIAWELLGDKLEAEKEGKNSLKKAQLGLESALKDMLFEDARERRSTVRSQPVEGIDVKKAVGKAKR